MLILFSLSLQLVMAKHDIIAYIIIFVMYICVFGKQLTSVFDIEKRLSPKTLDLAAEGCVFSVAVAGLDLF